MSATFSPTAPAHEIAGMNAAQKYFDARPDLPAAKVRQVGQWGYANYAVQNREAFGDGFRRMAYILSQMRPTA